MKKKSIQIKPIDIDALYAYLSEHNVSVRYEAYNLFTDGKGNKFPDNYVYEINIEWGDWKHDHAYCDYLMGQIGYSCVESRLTEEDGSDTYSAIHRYVFNGKIKYMDKEKTINEIINFIKKDKGVKKHIVGEVGFKKIGLGQTCPEIRVYWNSKNFATAKPVIRRISEVYGDIISSIGFYKGYSDAYIIVPLNNLK